MTSGTLVTCFPTCITCYRYVKDFLLHCWSDITYQYLSQEYNPDILPPLEPRGEPGKDGPAHHKGTCCPCGVDVVLVHPPALQKKFTSDSICYPPMKDIHVVNFDILMFQIYGEVAGSWRYDSLSMWLGLFPHFCCTNTYNCNLNDLFWTMKYIVNIYVWSERFNCQC